MPLVFFTFGWRVLSLTRLTTLDRYYPPDPLYEEYTIDLPAELVPGMDVTVKADAKAFTCTLRFDTKVGRCCMGRLRRNSYNKRIGHIKGNPRQTQPN
eukprot:1194576-Prorocentrum_minimum.AAC.7